MSDEMKRYVVELKNKTIVGEDYYVFDFKKPDGISFKEGQYGVFMHVDKEIEGRKVRAFSIASSNNENFFRIATKIVKSPSDFKAKMLDLNVGDTMTYDGPMGSFLLEEEFDSVFIAGGIGITPIRGVLKQLEELQLDKKAVLIYSESRGIYPFKKEFKEMDFLEKYCKMNILETQETINNTLKKYRDKAFYYIAGSPGFIKGVQEQLIEGGIEKTKIKFDRFNGY